jgi:hypothetical protein
MAERSDEAARRWVDEHRAGARADDGLAFYDRLAAVSTDDLVGRWRGSGLPTGSPFDGLLEAYSWYGKEFVDAEMVHPLLFRDGAGRPRPVDPELIPLGLLRERPGLARQRVARAVFTGVRPLPFTRRAKARIRMVRHRGVVMAAMVYDDLPIIDVFRWVTADTVLGFMDLRGLPDPFFFVLDRERPAS